MNESIRGKDSRAKRIAALKDFAEMQGCVYRCIKDDEEEFSSVLSEGESREDWLFEELATFIRMVEEL